MDEEYTYGGYFREKQIKLDQQFEASRKTESKIFEGVLAAVDGYTEDITALEIRQILSRHGGTYAQYVWTPGITHLITSNLPSAKVRKEISVKRRKPMAIVTPNWIIDSLKAKRQLPWGDYALAQLHAPDQTTLNSWRSQQSSSLEPAQRSKAPSNKDVPTSSASLGMKISEEILVADREEDVRLMQQPKRLFVRLKDDPLVIGSCLAQRIDFANNSICVLSDSSHETFLVVAKSHNLDSRADLIVGSKLNDVTEQEAKCQLKLLMGNVPNDPKESLHSLATVMNSEASIRMDAPRDQGELPSDERHVPFSQLATMVVKEDHEPDNDNTARTEGNAQYFKEKPSILFVEYDPVGAECVCQSFAESLLQCSSPVTVDIVTAREAFIEVAFEEDVDVVRARIQNVLLSKLSFSIQVDVVVMNEPFDEWAIRSKHAGLFRDLICVPFEVAARIGTDVSVEDAIVPLIERNGEEEKKLRKICGGAMRRPLAQTYQSEGFVENVSARFQVGESDRESRVSAQVKVNLNSSSPDDVVDTLMKRLLSRPASKSVLDSDSKAELFLTINVKSSGSDQTRSSVVAESDIYAEVLRMFKDLLREGQPNDPLVVRADLSRSAFAQPPSFSQISPHVLKQLPREVVRDLKRQYGKPSSQGSDFPLIPERFSQLDRETLKELPPDIRMEVEQAFASTRTPAPKSRVVPTLPRSVSQIDSSVFAELPEDIQRSIEKHFGRSEKRPLEAADDEPVAKLKKKRVAKVKPLKQKVRFADEEDEEVQVVEDMNSRSSFPETYSQIDLKTLGELPRDVADEIEREFRFKRKPAAAKKSTLDTFGLKVAAKSRAIRNDPQLQDDELSRSSIVTSSAPSFLGQESFADIRSVVTGWLSRVASCPHEEDVFESTCMDYVHALLDVEALDMVVSLMSLLKRLCAEKDCAAHGDAHECWKLAQLDLERRVLRDYRKRFDGSTLCLDQM